MVAWQVWKSWGATLGQVVVLEELGVVADWRVCIVEAAGRGLVQLILCGKGEGGEADVQMFLSASEARLLAQWMRLAATPGRTLADARRRLRKAAG